ncbi:MAG: DNA repair exonuclease [Calditrichaeota bacterium]|nr:MAG: DNA repair exonuclease [Calditrichota bacterium]
MPVSIKILFFADSHLGFDLPMRPRIQRRRRGEDFFANFQTIIKTAAEEKVDLVLHGGDLFFWAKLPNALVTKVALPLYDLAESGVPIYIVPGNHERSRIPNHFGFAHRNIHIFNRPRTFVFEKNGFRLALAGFPFARNIYTQFNFLINKTEYKNCATDVRLLCLHQAISGARVGAANYTFRQGPEIIPAHFLTNDFHAVLSGHIHRAQILTSDSAGRAFSQPVIYPGSIERTSFAERNEEKGFYTLQIDSDSKVPKIEFCSLPTRPMFKIELNLTGLNRTDSLIKIKEKFSTLPKNAVVQLKLVPAFDWEISASALRDMAPESMNVSLAVER